MSLTEIIFRLFAWARPLLWYYHRLGYLLRVAILCLEDDDYCLWLFDNPEARARFEGRLVDAERCLEIALALRTREILGLPMPITMRLGIGGFHRLHSPTTLERLAARLDRLVDRYNDIERLAQLRAARLRRESKAAPVLLIADHRSDDDDFAIPNPTTIFPRRPIGDDDDSSCVAIRGPPRIGLTPENQIIPNPQPHLRECARA